MHKIFLFLVLILIAIPHTTHADYDAGQQAYVSGNYKEAFRTWQQSAKEGDAKSQFQLGKMYEEGLGVPQNFVFAHVFYNLAASQGHKEGREARNALTKMMSTDQIGEAQQLASQWHSSSSPEQSASPAPSQTPPPTVANTPEALFMAADEGDIEKVKRLLDAGVGVDTRNDKGWTPLMGASFKGHIDIVRILLGKGAGVNAHGHDGTTALIAATLPGHLEIVKALVDAGADVKKKNTAGITARLIAKRKGHSQISNLFGPSPEEIEEEKRKQRLAEEQKRQRQLAQRQEEERRQRRLAEERARQQQLNANLIGSGNYQNGKRIYQITAKPMKCTFCHGINGDGMGKIGKALNPRPTNFTAYTMTSFSPKRIFETIKYGRKGTGMVGHRKTLTDSQIWDVVKYIKIEFVR